MYKSTFARGLNVFITLLYGLIAGSSLIYFLITDQSDSALQSLLGLGLLLLPWLFEKYTAIQLGTRIPLIYYLFTFTTVIIGSAFGGYGFIPYWDKLLHFTSGLLITMLGLIVYHLLAPTKEPLTPLTLPVALAFSFAFSMACAAIWEIYEYGLFIFFQVDAVNMLTTGAHDTLQDMTVCLLGSLIALWQIWRSNKGHHSFLYSTCQDFLEANHYFAKL